jgi:HK97 gp10 family phage protein
MAEMQVDVTGFEDLFKAMDELAEEIGKGKTDRIWRKALGESMRDVLDDARTFAPDDTGQLRDHIYMKVHKPTARDKASTTYMGEMYMARVTVGVKREDTKLNVVLNKRGKFQSVASNLKPVPVSQEFGNERLQNSEFGTAAMGAHPFMRPALDNNIEKVMSKLAQSLWYELTYGKYAKE